MNPREDPTLPSSHRSLRDVEGYNILAELALNLRWAWNHATDEIWSQLDPDLWEASLNPWVVLQTTSRDRIEAVLANPEFRETIDRLVAVRRHKLSYDAWYSQSHPIEGLNCVAYFSMEYMLSEALPIYSGGLGNVAGDQLKAASDLGVPVVGVGLLYQQGYFRQRIDENGAQEALYPYNEPGQLPLVPVRQKDGEWLRIHVEFPLRSVWLRTWQVQVGRLKLYLLDSNDAANDAIQRSVTSELYGGGPELRLRQELLLGIGGWRLLAAIGIHPQVCHLNEGHAAFAILERARTYMAEHHQPFDVAMAATRPGNLFTTHTAVSAGFDRFAPELIETYLGQYANRELGITANDLLALGRENPNDAFEPFNMAYLAARGSGAVNGVSRLHQEVSRQIFQPLFPRWPREEVPVGHVTNGVHMPTWDSPQADALWTKACGQERWLGSTNTLERDIRKVSDKELWQFRSGKVVSLVEFARARVAGQLRDSGAAQNFVEGAAQLFDPKALTLGFARRFATYKRPNLLLHDPDRLMRLLTNPERPVQLFIAGKAHPQDLPGQALIRDWVQFTRRPEVRSRVAFLSDYDMRLTEQLVRGVDVWINTPRRPWEASGTSGMKVLVNGGINVSELDGWWVEAYSPEVGWALGDGAEHGEDAAWDAAEAEALYTLLEQEIVPEFYTRHAEGIPAAWVERMRESMAQLTPRFSAERAVREYAEQFYLPAAAAFAKRTADESSLAKRIAEWQREISANWDAVRFGELSVKRLGDDYEFEVEVFLNGIDPGSVRVELFANNVGADGPTRLEMSAVGKSAANSESEHFRASAPASRPSSDYTPRVLPRFDEVSIPLENPRVLWQK